MTPSAPTDEEMLDAYYISADLFFESLDALLDTPDSCCAQLGDYNTAWELKAQLENETSWLLHNWAPRLSPALVSALQVLAKSLQDVPANELPAGAGRASNRLAMEHPSWASPRAAAQALLPLLSSIRHDVMLYFRAQGREP